MTVLLDHLEKLKFFVEIGKQGSIHRAARASHVSQPALSRSIKTLESILDSKLLERRSTGVVLTSAGQELYEFARKLLNEAADIELRVRNTHESGAGKIAVGSYEYLMGIIWAGVLTKLQAQHPNLHIAVSSRDGFIPIADALDEFDLIVDVEPANDPRVLTETLFADHFALFTAPGNFDKSTLIYVPSAIDGTRKTLREWLPNLELQCSRIYEVDTFETARCFCAAGLGLAILPMSLGQREIAAKRLKSVPKCKPFGEHRVRMSVLRESSKDLKIKLVKEYLISEHFRSVGLESKV